MQMIPGETFRSRVGAEFGGGKDPLPRPFPAGVGIFFPQAFGQVRFALTGGEVAPVAVPHLVEMVVEALLQRARQGNDTVFSHR